MLTDVIGIGMALAAIGLATRFDIDVRVGDAVNQVDADVVISCSGPGPRCSTRCRACG